MDFPSIAKQVAERRKSLGIGQRALEPLTGLKQPHIARIEGGQDVRLSTLVKVARALSASLVLIPRDRLAEVQALLGAEPGEIHAAYSADDFDAESFKPYADLEVSDDD